VQGLISNTGYFRSRVGYPYLIILTFKNLDVDYLSTKGLLAVHIDEISFINQLERFCDKPPTELTLREKIAVQSSDTFCLSMSDQCFQRGDLVAAVQWAELLLDYPIGLSPGYRKIYNIYIKSGNLDAAEEVARRALNSQPASGFFITKMKELAILRKDQASEEYWKQREGSLRKKETLETIIEKMKDSNVVPVVNAGNSKSLQSPQEKGLLGKIRKLFN
jgi:hypothetical protein